MLVVVSDLHLQHVSADPIRYVQDGIVRESGVRRNVTPGAFQMLLADVHARAKRSFSNDIELVFAGDIFELLRTPLWFCGGATDVRPMSTELGPDSPWNPLCARVHEILDAIIEDNNGIWPVLARFVREGTLERKGNVLSLEPGTVVRTHYIPGNHDRLVNAWPSVRRHVREILCMPASDRPFPHSIERPKDTGYSVKVRHGHEYDRWNIGVPVPFGKPIDLTDEQYLAPCSGDYVTLEIATRLCVGFRALHGHALRSGDERGERMRDFYNALVEFDDVRPPSLLLKYLESRLGSMGSELFELLRPVLLDLYLTALDSPFFQDMAHRMEMLKFFREPVVTIVREALQSLSPTSLESLVQRLREMDTSSDTDRSAAMASREAGVAEGLYDIVIAGHTHHPDQVPLPNGGIAGREVFFLDSGTWRSTIRVGIGDSFGRMRAYTIVMCYSDEECQKMADGRRFETWTGHLAGEKFGPYDIEIGPLAPMRSRFVMHAIRFDKVDEGDTNDGAEVFLCWGVDGTSQIFERNAVHDGSRVALDKPPIDLHSNLDGEFWIYGRELDSGSRSVVDADDVFPWSVRYLRRNSKGEFVPGKGEVILHRRDNTHIVLEYEVVTAE
jgi:UDP-2,3-diacylglucosamine pyrophosphatase LpxH